MLHPSTGSSKQRKQLWLQATAVSVLSAATLALGAQAPSANATAEMSPRGWADAASANELHIIEDDGTFPVRYRIHKVDAKGDVTREVIECREGTVARLIERNGLALTHEEDDAERHRLLAILDNPSDFLRHQKRNIGARNYATALVKLMPEAMLFSYAPGQPQPPGVTTPQVVLDFRPDPRFKPPTMTAEILTGLEGRMWIDKTAMRMTRVDGRIVRAVNFGWGVLAHVYPGGTVEFEQAEVAPERWIYSRVDENITVREMMMKTAVQKAQMSVSDVRVLPAQLSYREAINQLLAENLTLR